MSRYSQKSWKAAKYRSQKAVCCSWKSHLQHFRKEMRKHVWVLPRRNSWQSYLKAFLTSLTEHSIDKGDAKPVHLPPYQTSPLKKQLPEDQIGKMLNEGIIEPIAGPWNAPVVIFQKSCGEPWFCVDYCGLNQLTIKDSYPLPRVDEPLDFLSPGTFLTIIDNSRFMFAGLTVKLTKWQFCRRELVQVSSCQTKTKWMLLRTLKSLSM